MTNFIQDGETLEYSNTGAAIASGAVVIVGTVVGIAATDIAATTGVGTVVIEGVFNLPKVAATAIGQGELVYWDATPGEVTTVSAGNTLMGKAHAAAGSADTTCNVRLFT